MTIREIDLDRDGERVAALVMATSPLGVTSTEAWTHSRRARPERARELGQVAVDADGVIVGFLDTFVDFFHQGETGRITVRVDPAHRRRGLGGRLYDLGLDRLRSLGVTRLASAFDESDDAVAFARARGWVERRGESLSALDPSTVAAAPDPAHDVRPARDLDTHELHAVDEEATRDMPLLEPLDAIPYDEWLDFVWNNPIFSRDGSFGAVVDGHVVAVSLITANVELGRGFSLFTGTLRDHRGRGLARSVKLASVRWAAANGIHTLLTANDETNTAMLAVNRRLGYRLAGRRVEYARDV